MMEQERTMQKFEYTESVQKIKAWKAHFLWSSNQEEAEQCPPEVKQEITPCDNALGGDVPTCPIQRTD